ncbi:MAG: POTRA domain-containing protein, partial [Albidovulum sp.]
MLAYGRIGSEHGQGLRNGLVTTVFLIITTIFALNSTPAQAQNYSFSNIVVEGNENIESATVAKFAGIVRGQAVTDAGLNDAVQRIVASGLFASVDVVPSGGTLIIRVTENPVINIINFEGNRRLKDENLAEVVKSQSRRVYSASQAEADAAAIVQAYS